MRKNALIAATLFGFLLGLPAFAGSAEAACVSGRQARQILEQGKAMPLPQALQQAGLSSDQVVDAKLCQAGGGYVYRVRVLQRGGQMKAVNIPAS